MCVIHSKFTPPPTPTPEKKFKQGGGGRAPGAPVLDPPLVATTAIIVLAVVFTKLRSNTTANLVYYIQSPDGCTIMSPDNQVPCRNPNTDTYTDIKDLQDISMSRFGGILESDKIDALKMKKLSKITETV